MRKSFPFCCDCPVPHYFTRDFGFYDRRFRHARYCLVHLAVKKDEIAIYVRRLLRHRKFDTKVKRMETVIRVAHIGLSVWQLHEEKELHLEWAD